MQRFAQRSIPATLTLLLMPALLLWSGCSGEGPDVVLPGAEEMNQTAILGIDAANGGELARYAQGSESLIAGEYQSANGAPLSITIDAVYERYEKLWLVDNRRGTIVILGLGDRVEEGRIEGLPRSDSATPEARMNGMAFSNLSQAWLLVYGTKSLIHIDARNLVAVRTVELPGEPTAITTIDNRVFIGLEMADGSGAVGLMRSNDPDLAVEVVASMRRPPIYMGVNSDEQHIAMIVPGETTDNPETPAIDTDPALFMMDLLDYSLPFDGRIIAPNLLDLIGHHPVFASMTKDFFIYLATPEGVKRIDTQAWGDFIDFLPGAHSVVTADYYTDLVYAVPSNDPSQVERITKFEERLSTLTLPGPVNAMTFVSTSKVSTP